MVFAKKKSTAIRAWELGAGTAMEEAMISQKKIVLLPNERYEVFSRECMDGKGEIAQKGDFFKVDSQGFPYPNSRAFFLSNHIHLEDDRYIQISKPLKIWNSEMEISEEIQYLMDNKRLFIHPENLDQYYSANLWGTLEKAPWDAIILFYSIDRDATGKIVDISFNFVRKPDFDLSYDLISENP